MLDITHLRQIREVVRSGSFNQAAKRLGVSQPTLSKNMARLEDRLRQTLFVRNGRSLAPTPLAKYIADHSDDVLSGLEQLMASAVKFSDGQSGLVKLGLAAIPAKIYLTDLILTLRDRYPDIVCELITDQHDVLTEKLDSGDLDALVCHADPDALPAGAKVDILESMDIIFVAHKDHPCHARNDLTISDIFEYPSALPVLTPAYRMVLTRTYGVDPDNLDTHVSSADYAILLDLVRDAGFFTAGPARLFEEGEREGWLKRTPLRLGFQHDIGVMTRTQTGISPATLAVIETLRNIAKAR